MPTNGYKKSISYNEFKVINEVKSQLISIEDLERKTQSLREKKSA